MVIPVFPEVIPSFAANRQKVSHQLVTNWWLTSVIFLLEIVNDTC